MSGRDNRPSGQITSAMGKIKDKLMRSVTDADDHLGYERVQGGEGSLSTSTTATSLDTILVDDPFSYQEQRNKSPTLQFAPILEGDDINEPPKLPGQQQKSGSTKKLTGSATELQPLPPPPQSTHGHSHHYRGAITDADLNRSKQSLKGSKVSFEKKNDSSDEDSFEGKRDEFQQQKTVSVDHKGILKDLKNILANDNRRQFQAKKHVSLDIRGTTFLEDLLRDSSSEEEFHKTRKDFQGRKHQSLDPRVSFKLKGDSINTSSTDSEEEGDTEQKRLIHRYKDITKPVIIDFKDLESDDEDYISARQAFQAQRAISIESRKSHRFYEMDEMGSKKSENLRHSVPFVRQITEDGKPKLEVYRPTTNPIYIWTQGTAGTGVTTTTMTSGMNDSVRKSFLLTAFSILFGGGLCSLRHEVLAALSVSLGSLVVGFASAYTSPALVSMVDRNLTSFEVTPQAASWVGGLMPLAGLAGGIAGGPFIEYIGRRNTILATAVPFIVAWLLIGSAINVGMVLAGRALSGFCVGIASLSLPVYLGETVQPEVRGTLGLLPTAFGNIGILLCFVAGTYMDWSSLAYLGGALPIPFLILMFLIPETPRWYVSRNREERARKALVWLRGKEADVEPELKGLLRSQADAERSAGRNTMFELLRLNNLKPLGISLGLMFFQQLSGINAVIFYTVSIFKDAGSTIDGNVCTIIVGIVNFAATFIATMLIDRLGRKILLYISDVAMIITLFTLGGFFYCKSSGMDVSAFGWLPLASFVIFVVGFSLGFGPIPWLMMGEILPAKIRGSAASVATAFNWACTFVVTKTFQDMIDSMGAHGAFWLFGSICFIGLFFVIFYVPETQGKSLEDIERKMMGRVRRMSSVANIKPLSFNM